MTRTSKTTSRLCFETLGWRWLKGMKAIQPLFPYNKVELGDHESWPHDLGLRIPDLDDLVTFRLALLHVQSYDRSYEVVLSQKTGHYVAKSSYFSVNYETKEDALLHLFVEVEKHIKLRDEREQRYEAQMTNKTVVEFEDFKTLFIADLQNQIETLERDIMLLKTACFDEVLGGSTLTEYLLEDFNKKNLQLHKDFVDETKKNVEKALSQMFGKG